MKLTKITAIILLSSIVAGCGSVPKINIFKKNVAAPVPVNRPQPMALGEVSWKVYKANDLKKLISDLEANGDQDTVYYVMSKDSYDILSMNLAEMKRYIADQAAESKQLRDAIDINAGKK